MHRHRPAIGPALLLPPLAGLAAAATGILIGGTSAILGAALVIGAALACAIALSDEAALIALVATITLLPFATLPIKIGLSPTFLDLLCVVLLVRWLGRRVNPQFATARSTPLNALVWIWLSIALVALLAAAGRTPLTSDTLHYFVKVVLSTLIFFFVVDVVRTRQRLQRLYAAFCLGGAGAAAIGIVLYLLHPSTSTRLLNLLGILHYPTGTDVLRYRVDFNLAERAISTSVDPNVLGGLLMLSIILTLAQLVAERPFLRRRWWAVLLAPLLPCLLMSYSRSSWVGLFIAFLFMGVWRYRRLLVVGLVVLAFFVQLPVSHRFTRQLISGLQAKDQAAAMRLGEASDALRLITTYPAFGVGFGGSPDLNLYVGVSNIYLLMAEEVGLGGLAVFLAAIVVFFFWLLRSLARIHDPPSRDLAFGLCAAAVAAFAAGMLDRYFFSFQSDIALMWWLLGMGVVAVRIGQSPPPEA
ncbi:MAG TPA: O-antigen ligase family protein, partial [Chloroflexota bacterium]